MKTILVAELQHLGTKGLDEEHLTMWPIYTKLHKVSQVPFVTCHQNTIPTSIYNWWHWMVTQLYVPIGDHKQGLHLKTGQEIYKALSSCKSMIKRQPSTCSLRVWLHPRHSHVPCLVSSQFSNWQPPPPYSNTTHMQLQKHSVGKLPVCPLGLSLSRQRR